MNLDSVPTLEEIPGRFARLQDSVAQAVSKTGRDPESVAIELAAKFQASERILAAIDRQAPSGDQGCGRQRSDWPSLHGVPSAQLRSPPC